jgi:hypothetical protein
MIGYMTKMRNYHYQIKKIDFLNQNMIIIIYSAKRDKLFMIHIHLFYFHRHLFLIDILYKYNK